MNLPIEILGYITIFLDYKHRRKVIYLPNTRLKHNWVDKVYYIPPDEHFVSKYWYKAIKYFQCNICINGKYNINTKKCMKCGHIMESGVKRHRRVIKN